MRREELGILVFYVIRKDGAGFEDCLILKLRMNGEVLKISIQYIYLWIYCKSI